MTFVDLQPSHPRVADAVGDLESGNTSEIAGEAADQQFRLHATELRHVVVVFVDIRRKFGNRMACLLGSFRMLELGLQFDLE